LEGNLILSYISLYQIESVNHKVKNLIPATSGEKKPVESYIKCLLEIIAIVICSCHPYGSIRLNSLSPVALFSHNHPNDQRPEIPKSVFSWMKCEENFLYLIVPMS